MSKCEIERNAEIVMARRDGMTFREIAEWYGITTARAQQICEKYKEGTTKEEIIRIATEKMEARKQEQEGWKQDQERWKERRVKRAGGKEYAIRNGAAEMFLTEIVTENAFPVFYRYGSRDVNDAMLFTLEQAEEIARKRKAVVCWVPR